MKIKLAALLALLMVAAVITFALRQQTLSELHAGNATLRQQLDAQSTAAASNSVMQGRLTNAVAELSEAERNELLRLRGQILPLRNEAEQASNRLAAAQQPNPPSAAATRGTPKAIRRNDQH